LFRDFSFKELKYYFGFGFLFFILTTFLFVNLFFRFIHDSSLSLYWVLVIHDSTYIIAYFFQIFLIAFFFRLNLKRSILFIVPQFYLYEYISGLFVQGLDYFILAPKTLFVRIIILAIGIVLIYLPLRYMVRQK